MKLSDILLSTTLFITPVALACQVTEGQETTAGNIALSYKIIDAPVEISQPFSLEIKLCKEDAPLTPKQLRINAGMPAHNHGMNYQPSITKLGDGHYQVDNFVFHMMGNWAFAIDVFTTDEKQTFSIDYTL